VHSASRAELIENLGALLERGNSMSMLFMTVRSTSCGMIASVVPEELVLDIAHGTWRGFFEPRRFRNFCGTQQLKCSKETWGREKVSRAYLGRDPSRAAKIIDACFGHMFNQRGSFAIDFRYVGWQRSNTSLERTRGE
jgi:hypothetical protein